jgi:hypothetical protein
MPAGYNLSDHVGGRRKVDPLYYILLGLGLAFALGLVASGEEVAQIYVSSGRCLNRQSAPCFTLSSKARFNFLSVSFYLIHTQSTAC